MMVAVVGVVFQSARTGALLAWDDDINLLGNPHVRGLTWENLRWMFTDTSHMRRYVPLAWLGWAVDDAWFGLTATSCHVGNILFHAANAVLVFLVLRAVLAAWQRSHGNPDTERGWLVAAAAGALLWAVHPLRVEVVAWASGRIYAQTAFFLLGSTLAYLKAAEPGARTRAWRWTAFAAFVASLLTYPLGVSYVAVLVVMDLLLLRRIRPGVGWWRDPGNRAVWLEKIAYLAATAVVLGITLAARFHPTAMWAPPVSLEEFGAGKRAMQAFFIWAYYGWKPFVPTGLAPVYLTLVWFDPAEPAFVLSAAAVTAVTVVLVWRRRRWPAALALWLCHLAVLVPVLGLTEHPHYPNDRYSYLPGVLPSIALAASLVAWPRWRRLATPVAAAVMVMLGALSVAQIGIWRDSETLFRYLYRHVGDTPYRADIALRLGDVLRVQGRVMEAELNYEESLRLQPTGVRAGYGHWGMGRVAQMRGRLDAAVGHYERAIQLAPALADPYVDLGELRLKAGRAGEAVDLLRRGVALEPARADAHLALGRALAQVGRPDEAAAAVREALRLNPQLEAPRPAPAPLERR